MTRIRRRTEHVVWPVKGKRQPSMVVCVEAIGQPVVTDGGAHKQANRVSTWSAFCWRTEPGKVLRRRMETGTNVSSWWALVHRILKQGGLVWCFSMNAVRVHSLLGLWERLEEGSMEIAREDPREQDREGGPHECASLGFCVIEDPPTIIYVKVPGLAGTLKIVDVRNYGVKSWKSLAATAISHCDEEPLPTDNEWMLQTLAQYRADAVAMYVESMIDTLERNDLGSLQSTAAAQAWYTFRKKYLPAGLLVHNHGPALRLERAACIGGRCEAFRIGRVPGTVYQLDFRSQYPSVCSTEYLPIRMCHYVSPERPTSVLHTGGQHCIILRCKVEITEPKYPYRKDGIVIYPVGEFWTVLAGPELFMAYTRDEVRQFGEYVTYQSEPFLSNYVNDLFALRIAADKRGDSAAADWIKKLLVSLPGKFAQHGRRWVDAPKASANRPYHTWHQTGKDGVRRRYRSVAWKCQVETEEGEGMDSIPAAAAWIYSEARRRLWHAITVARMENVLYVDTDSLFVNEEGYKRLCESCLVYGNVMGALRLIGSSDGMTINGIKDYEFAGRRVVSGPGEGTMAKGVDAADVMRFRKPMESISQGKRPLSDEVRNTGTRHYAYKHGQVLDNGRVVPWVIHE